MIPLLLACGTPTPVVVPTATPTPTESPLPTGDTGAAAVPLHPVGTLEVPYSVTADATWRGQSTEDRFGNSLLAAPLEEAGRRTVLAQQPAASVAAVTLREELAVFTGPRPTVLSPGTGADAARLLTQSSAGVDLWSWPFDQASSIPAADFAPSSGAAVDDASPWGHPGHFVSFQDGRVVLHTLDDDDAVSSSTDLFSDPLGHQLQAPAVSGGIDRVALRAVAPNADRELLLVAPSTGDLLMRETDVEPLTSGTLGPTAGAVDLLVASTLPGVWRLHLLGPDDTGTTDARTRIELPVRPSTYSGLGSTVAVADLDGDGHDDLVVGQPQENTMNPSHDGLFPGLLVVFRGPIADGMLTAYDADLVFAVDDPDVEGFGTALATVDGDGDGRAELYVGAPRTDSLTGVVYRFDDVLRPWREANGL